MKDKILSFLKSNPKRKFTVSEIANNLNISYGSCLKYVDILIAENSIKVIDLGNAKVVWYDNENQ